MMTLTRSIPFFLTLGLLGSVQLQAGSVDWSGGSWDNGAGYNTGYDNSATSGTTISNGITATATYTPFNVTPQAANLTVSNVADGSGTDPTLELYVANDANTGSVLSKYVTLTISFSQAVTLTNPFTIFDVDQSNPTTGFNDYIAVRARIGGSTGTGVGITYTPTGSNQVAANDYGLAGIKANIANVAADSDAGNVSIATAGKFDYLEIYFTQAVGNTGGSKHLIGISDLNFTVVPEPSTNLLLLCGLGFIGYRGLALRKSRKSLACS